MTKTWRCIAGTIMGMAMGFAIGALWAQRPTFNDRFYFQPVSYKGDRLHFNIYGAGPPHCVVLMCRVV